MDRTSVDQAVRSGSGMGIVLVCLILLLSVGLGWRFWRTPGNVPSSPPRSEESHEEDRFAAIHIRKPAGPPVVRLGIVGPDGVEQTLDCNVCHATKPPDLTTRHSRDLNLFHQGLMIDHGALSCITCHNPVDGYATLHLADGRSLPYPEVMQLCAQCHGTQYRDYQRGSHGGMTGFWDLQAGPRERNNCVDCHDPHAPKYPEVMPAPGPRDRFLTPPISEGASHG